MGSGGSHAVRDIDAAVSDAAVLDSSRDTRDAVTDAQGSGTDSAPSPCGSQSCANPGAPLDHLRLELRCAARMGTTNSCNMGLPAGLTSCPKEGLNVHVTASFGLATFPHDAKDKHELLAEADRCLFQSKAAGKNRISVASAGHRTAGAQEDSTVSLVE